jgi:hypothetical protein
MLIRLNVQALELAVWVAKAQAGGEVRPAAFGKARALAKTGNLARRDPAWIFLAAQSEAIAATRSGAERASALCLKVGFMLHHVNLTMR